MEYMEWRRTRRGSPHFEHFFSPLRAYFPPFNVRFFPNSLSQEYFKMPTELEEVGVLLYTLRQFPTNPLD